jgi:hypothetical protein
MKRLVEIYTANPSDPSKRVMMHYVVVREKNESTDPNYQSNNPHYHLVLMFDGSKEDNGWTVLLHAEAILTRIVGESAKGCIHLCDSQFSRQDGIKIQKPRRVSAQPPGWEACEWSVKRALDVTTGAAIQALGDPALRPLTPVA